MELRPATKSFRTGVVRSVSVAAKSVRSGIIFTMTRATRMLRALSFTAPSRSFCCLEWGAVFDYRLIQNNSGYRLGKGRAADNLSFHPINIHLGELRTE